MRSIVDIARDWVNTPFVHQGRLKGVGVDCLGLVLGVYLEAGHNVPTEIPRYKTFERPGLLIEKLSEYGDQITDEEARPGDVVVFNYAEQPQHLAILTDIGLIEASATFGKVVETTWGSEHDERLHSYWRLKSEN